MSEQDFTMPIPASTASLAAKSPPDGEIGRGKEIKRRKPLKTKGSAK